MFPIPINFICLLFFNVNENSSLYTICNWQVKMEHRIENLYEEVLNVSIELCFDSLTIFDHFYKFLLVGPAGIF